MKVEETQGKVEGKVQGKVDGNVEEVEEEVEGKTSWLMVTLHLLHNKKLQPNLNDVFEIGNR